MSGGSLSIALSGLDAAQTGLDTVSENISNANTPGYLNETASLANQQVPGAQIGDGVTVTGVLQSSNSFTRQLELSANGTQSYSNQLQSLVTSAQNSFTEPSSNGIAEQMSTLYNDFASVADAPSQLAPRTQLVAAAQNLTTTINQAAQNLVSVYDQASSSSKTLVQTINTQLTEVASLNTQIASTSLTSGASNTLVDQQNQVIDKLASELGTTTVAGTSGQTTILIGGVALVQGGQVQPIAFSAPSAENALGFSSPAMTQLAKVTLQASGTTVPVTGGTLGATLTVLNSNLPTYGGYLNSLTTTLANTVNGQLADGKSTTASGTGSQTGIPLFVNSTAGTTLSATTLSVSSSIVDNPMLLAASGSSYSAGDGSNAQTIADQQTATTGSIANWASSVAQVGLDVQNATSLASNATTMYNQAYSAEQSVSGVQVNAQLVNLVNYQQVYQAAAKVISTVATTLQSLIQSV